MCLHFLAGNRRHPNVVYEGKQQGWQDELTWQTTVADAVWRIGANEHLRIDFLSDAGNGIEEAVLIVEQHSCCVSAKIWKEETPTRNSTRARKS